MKTRKLPHVRHAPCSQRAPLATSGRFRRPNQPEAPYSADVSPGRRSRQRTTPAENRTEAKDPRRNRRPFPAKPSRTRGGGCAGEAAAAVNADAGATRGIAANAPPSLVQMRRIAEDIVNAIVDAEAGHRSSTTFSFGSKS